MSTRPRIAITGIGAVTPLGGDADALVLALRRGDRGLRAIPHFVGTPFDGRVGGVVRVVGDTLAPAATRGQRGATTRALAVRAAREAMESAEHPGPGPWALVLGTTMTPKERPLEQLVAEIRAELDLPTALAFAISTACTSSSAVFALASDLLRAGHCDVALCGGADELDVKSFAGFAGLGLVHPTGCTPFGDDVGTTLGEGAAFFTLETEARARGRGARILAFIDGAASTSDGHHPTSPHPAGDGLARAALAALKDADVAPGSIDWVSAHGTGTRANDAAECRALERVFGERAAAIPITAAKGLVGHALGAAGAVEIAVVVLSMRAAIIHGGAPIAARRADCAFDVVGSPREAHASHVLKLAAAFGGANAALVISTPDASLPARPALARRAVRVAGMGGLGPGDATLDPMGREGDLVGRVGPFRIESLLPTVDPRGLDAIGRHLVVAVARALGPVGGLWGPAAARAGLFVGQRRASPASHVEFEESVASRGLERASGSAFTRKVVNAATGAVARAFALRGPTTTLSSGPSSGLLAIALAAEHLATRSDADLLVAGAAEELAPEEDAATLSEGAAVVALSALSALSARSALSSTADDGAPPVELLGWALGGPSEQDAVLARALAHAGSPQEVLVRRVGEVPGGARAMVGVLTLGRAVRDVERGAAGCVVVVEGSALASVAIVVGRGRIHGG